MCLGHLSAVFTPSRHCFYSTEIIFYFFAACPIYPAKVPHHYRPTLVDTASVHIVKGITQNIHRSEPTASTVCSVFEAAATVTNSVARPPTLDDSCCNRVLWVSLEWARGVIDSNRYTRYSSDYNIYQWYTYIRLHWPTTIYTNSYQYCVARIDKSKRNVCRLSRNRGVGGDEVELSSKSGNLTSNRGVIGDEIELSISSPPPPRLRVKRHTIFFLDFRLALLASGLSVCVLSTGDISSNDTGRYMTLPAPHIKSYQIY